jgi:cytochrome c553
MHDMSATSTTLIVIAVLLFFFLGIAIMVIMDHKAKLPGGFTSNPFSVVGMRRDHPVIAFLTTVILFGIIGSLLAAMIVTVSGYFDLFKPAKPPGLLSRLSEGRTAERLRHFHNLPAQDVTTLGAKTVCFSCHGDFPHSKEPMIRTLLNMHTQFIGCMTCHADDRKVPESALRLRWLNFSGIAVTGRPFGTDIEPDSGYLAATDDVYSKIVPYARVDGQEKLLEITLDDPEAREFAKIQHKLSDHDREAVKNTFHRLVSPKGRFCSRCHTDEGRSYVPFRELGFSERRIRDVTNLSIIGLVQKYKNFYMPSLLRSDKSLPSTEVLTGPDRPAARRGTSIQKDPRAWWKETYDAPKGDAKK